MRLPLDELPDDPRTEVAELPREEELDEPLTLVPVALPLDELLDDPRTEVAELPREDHRNDHLSTHSRSPGNKLFSIWPGVMR